jgi:hypothetical protein
MLRAPMSCRFAPFTLSVALATLGASCTPAQPACSPDDPCGGNQACVVGRCRDPGANVASVDSTRVVLHATSVAVLSSGDVPVDARVTPLGARRAGDVVVLLQFDADVGQKVEIEGAFLIVEPELASPGPAQPVEIDVVPILSSWSPASVSWARSPSLGVAVGEAKIPAARRAPLRVDVTAHVAKRRGVGYGLALAADGSDPIGARLVTIARSSNGPKLELYLKAP